MKRIILFFNIIVLLLFLSACGFLGGKLSFSSNDYSDTRLVTDDSSQEQIVTEEKDSTTNEKFDQDSKNPNLEQKKLDEKSIDLPRGSFLLGEYYSPKKDFKFKVWSWYDNREKRLNGEFVFYDIKEGLIKKIKSSELVENRRKNRREPVVWLDSRRALLNGFFLFNSDDVKIYDLRPKENFQVWDYHVNDSRSALALIGKNPDEKISVWMIDLDTLYKLPVYSYSLESPWYTKNNVRVSWGPDNNIYFDVDYYGRPTIFIYDTLEDKCEIYLYDATLLSIDQRTGEIKYAKLTHNNEFKSHQEPLSNSGKNDESKKVLEVAKKYMEATGRNIGQEVGKNVIFIEKIIGGKALVAFGPWASEYTGVLILNKVHDNWVVTYEKNLYYFNMERMKQAVNVLIKKESLDFGKEPGKYVIGCPYRDEKTAVFMIGPYGEPWEKEFILNKKDGKWIITNEMELEGISLLPTSNHSPAIVVNQFLNCIRDNEVNRIKNYIIYPRVKEGYDIKSELQKIDVSAFNIGELRLAEDSNEGLVQCWIFRENTSQNAVYMWVRCLEISGDWKIDWNDFVEKYKNMSMSE